MRSLLSWVTGSASRSAAREGGSRPEALRRRTLATNSLLILSVSALGLPVVLWLLITGGMVLPFVLDIMGLTVGFLTLALHHRGLYERAAAGQVYGTLMTGLLLAVADPAIADF